MSVRVQARVWEQSQHGGTALLMLLAIADFADDDGRAYPAVATLAAKCRMQPRNANVILATLRKSGDLAIRIGEGPKGTNLYHVLPLQRNAPLQDIAPLHSNASPPAIQGIPPLQRNAVNPSVNHHEPSFSLQPSVADQKVKLRKRVDDCPYDAILDLYREHCPGGRDVTKLTDKRKGSIAARWREIISGDYRLNGGKRVRRDRDGALRFLASYFDFIEGIDWCTGRLPMRDGRLYRVTIDKLFAADFMAARSDEAHDKREAA